MTTKKAKIGFAGGISAERRREIARKGGMAAHATGVAHEFTREEARLAGQKGGKARQAKLRHAKAVAGEE